MSEENVEIVRRAWDAWGRGDLDGILAVCTEDLIFVQTRDWPEPEYRGPDGLRRFLTEWLDLWDEFEVGVDEVLPAPDGPVVSLFWQRGKGRQSGLSIDMEYAIVSTLRGDQMARIEVYDDRAEALKAVGLEE